MISHPSMKTLSRELSLIHCYKPCLFLGGGGAAEEGLKLTQISKPPVSCPRPVPCPRQPGEPARVPAGNR